jgi:hypothetical protein
MRFLVAFMALSLLTGCAEKPSEKAAGREQSSGEQLELEPNKADTGFVFPPLAEITNMTVRASGRSGPPNFDVPQSCWKDVLSALSPSQYDPDPCKWQELGCLRIDTREKRRYEFCLYDLPQSHVGAFSGLSGSGADRYYRGGNSMQLRLAIDNAYAQSRKRVK